MVTHLCVTPERPGKTSRIMEALKHGWDGPAQVVHGAPPDDGEPFVVWGQAWLAAEIIPQALREGRPFWQIDNGFFRPARGGDVGYYRFAYRGLAPVLLMDAPKRLGVDMAPWRADGRHVVLGVPGEGFGRAIGLDMPEWTRRAHLELQRVTRRPIVVRHKTGARPLSADLRNAWALVTHSSNVAVDAVRAGIPVFVAATNPAAPVGVVGLGPIERPVMPERRGWWRSLMAQQFTLEEMADGTAARCLRLVAEQVDGGGNGLDL